MGNNISKVSIVASKTIGPQLWRLECETNKWLRPLQVTVDNNIFELNPKYSDEKFDEPYFDYRKDIKNGVYYFTGISVAYP